ncbi:putative transcription factor interactor and regulator CCHC(Zn) family [Helianthus anomalus]
MYYGTKTICHLSELSISFPFSFLVQHYFCIFVFLIIMTIESSIPNYSAASMIDDQQSGIRATLGKSAEIRTTSTTLPCQHYIDERNDKERRVPRVRLCYYCHQPGHQIYSSKSKENDEATQLLN